MRKTALAVAGFAALSACEAPDDYAGQIADYNGHMVRIEAFPNQPNGFENVPTPAMQASAEATCGGPAKFTGTESVGSQYYIHYRFFCTG